VELGTIGQFTAEILGRPSGQGNPQRITTKYSAYPAHTVAHRNLAVATLAAAWHAQHPDHSPIDVAVAVFVLARFARPRAHYGTGRNAAVLRADAPTLHTQAPDADKLARLVLDALTVSGVIVDDKYVSILRVNKRWAHIDSTKVVMQWRTDGTALAYGDDE
jgi:Holliday junction resolvase RusA-like endonuclease